MNKYRWRILGSGVLAFIFLALGGTFLTPLPSSSMKSDAFWSNKIVPNKTFDIVFIGDSRIYRGINPAKVEAALASFDSFSVFNYGFSSAGLDTAFMDAGAGLLSKTSKQPIIVLGVSPSALADENLENKHYWQEKNRTAFEIWQRKHINGYLSYFDPTRPSVLRNEYRGKKEGYYQVHHDNGWIASDKFPRNEWAGYGHVQQVYPEVDFSLWVRKNLIRKVAEWEAQGIQVFGFRPPAFKEMDLIETKKAYYPEEAIRAQFEAVGGTWLDIEERYTYITYDGNHLEAQSANRLSTVIGMAIKRTLLKEQHKEKSIIQQLSTIQGFENAIEAPWMPKQTDQLTQEQPFGGTTANKVPPNAYSCTYIQPLDDLLTKNLYIRASCWVKTKTKTVNSKAVLVISIQNNTETILWKGQRLLEQTLDPIEWNRIQLATSYQNNLEGCTLKAYIWNNSNTGITIDDFSVEVFDK